MLKRCSRCVLPTTYPGITFNEEGICNHCLTYRRKVPRGEEALGRLIQACQNGSKEYDCIVALSGGRDSAFAAYYAVKVLGLRALLYTFDNGFMPDQTTENVRNIAVVLGADHVIETSGRVRKNAKYVISCWIRKPSPATIAFLCNGCRSGYIRGLVKTAQDFLHPAIITGGGEPERSFAERLLSSTDSRRDKLSLISGFSMQAIQNPRYIANPGFLIELGDDFRYRFLYKIKRREKVIPIFRYIEWNEKDLMSAIQTELGWKTPSHSRSSWRADCRINELKNYLYLNTIGFTKHDELLSGMIRGEMMTRDEALERLSNDNVISQQFLGELFEELGLNLNDLNTALKEYGRERII